MTETTSNTASTTLLMPVLAAAALAADLPPELIMVPAAMSASCAYMLPVATAPNSVVYGSGLITTAQMAREGLLFANAYTPMAKCAPSRACILTGRHLWQNEEAGNHMAYFPAKLKSWPEVLMERGWHVGITGKGWAPGIAHDADGQPRSIAGKPFQRQKAKPPAGGISQNDYAANFRDFLDAAPEGVPLAS